MVQSLLVSAVVLIASSQAYALSSIATLTCRMKGSVEVNGRVVSAVENQKEVYSYRYDSIAKDTTNHLIPVAVAQENYLLFSDTDPTGYQAFKSFEELKDSAKMVKGRVIVWNLETNEIFYSHVDTGYVHYRSGECTLKESP